MCFVFNEKPSIQAIFHKTVLRLMQREQLTVNLNIYLLIVSLALDDNFECNNKKFFFENDSFEDSGIFPTL